MEIKTKYDIGQRVFYKGHYYVDEGTIVSINIKVGYKEDPIIISYCVNFIFFTYYSIKEEKLFPTKEELLKSL